MLYNGTLRWYIISFFAKFETVLPPVGTGGFPLIWGQLRFYKYVCLGALSLEMRRGENGLPGRSLYGCRYVYEIRGLLLRL